MSETIDFDRFLGQAWDDHGAHPAEVAARLAREGSRRVSSATQLSRLAQLVHHVHGTHLGTWDEGRAQLQALGAHAAADDGARADVQRCLASLAISAGESDPRPGLGASDRIRVAAMAAANLAERDTGRALQLFEQALAQVRSAALDATDPVHRALAAGANNLACTLEDKPGRSAAERELMIAAAQAARQHWERAGTWLEVERAEYRLAMTWLQAGEPAQARQHAQACLDIVQEKAAPALERLFAWEALGLAARAGGDTRAHRAAVVQAEQAWAGLDEADRAWCRGSLEQLRG